ILVLIASLIIGQLLKERTSKARMLYVTTVAMSLISLIAFMLLQTFGRIPPSASIVKPFKQTLHEAITMRGADANMPQILEEGFRQATVQLPGPSLNYPVLHGKTNHASFNFDFEREHRRKGSLFMDF
ncbi:DUF2232 domain-containing protein, partial [Staphylococcus aureus]|uniref:DUF2232 domain-containing protein n=1 Tax=Staphylococcus aureus TaxID=1280 RepID=UPI00210B743F